MPLERQQKNISHARPKPSVDSSELVDSLIDEHWQRLCRIVYRLVRDWPEAEDIALESFYRLHVQLTNGTQLANPAGWLYRVATNLGLNALRARHRRRTHENRFVSQETFEYANDNPAQVIEYDQEQIQVHQALRQMPQSAAQLLLLRYAGFSYQELAEMLQLAPASIGTRLARAEKQFSELYRKLIQ